MFLIHAYFSRSHDFAKSRSFSQEISMTHLCSCAHTLIVHLLKKHFLCWSAIVKSQQNSIELMTRPATVKVDFCLRCHAETKDHVRQERPLGWKSYLSSSETFALLPSTKQSNPASKPTLQTIKSNQELYSSLSNKPYVWLIYFFKNRSTVFSILDMYGLFFPYFWYKVWLIRLCMAY